MVKTFISTFTLIFSMTAFAINGQEYVDCLERAMNQSILEFKAIEAVRDQTKKIKLVKVCNSMSPKLYASFKSTFVEVDEKNKVDVPYTHEDMQLSKIEDYYLDVKEQMDCFVATKKDVNYQTIKLNNEKLITRMFQKMTGFDDLASNMSKTLEELDTTFCKNIQ